VPADPQNVQAVFLAAAEQDSAADRVAVLDRLCGADAELRRRVETLLRAHDAPGLFLVSPAADPVATMDEPAVAERTGSFIGPYRLMEQVGEGGMGLVFVAEQQQPVRRKVALKVIKPGMDTRQVIARFEAERQALALMDHPNIAKVLDAGETSAGRPYFVMELVKGIPITEYCDQNQVPVRDRLELFLHVCHAVQHAHQKGIIHRDIKPYNVMVVSHDGIPVPKIIDFGVAKAMGQQLTDKTLYTQIAQLVGTPLYMSPEQAGQSGLDIDTRTDIYALGVLLYELLTGTTPFAKERLHEAAYDQMLRIIREEEPPKPSTRVSTLAKNSTHEVPAEAGMRKAPTPIDTIAAQRKSDPSRLSQLCRGELDWIVMKCLEKDRNHRYETASSLARDVQSYLHDEPVQACPPSPWYRFRKFARRNRVLLVTTAVIAAILLAATATVTWKWWEAEIAGEQERAAREEAQEAGAKAQEASTQAQKDRDRALKAEAQGRLELGKSLLAQGTANQRTGLAGQRFASLDLLGRAAAVLRSHPEGGRYLPEIRDQAVTALGLSDFRVEWQRSISGRLIVCDARLEHYAILDLSGSRELVLRRIDDDRDLFRSPPPEVPFWYVDMSFSADGRYLAAAYRHHDGAQSLLRVWRLGNKDPIFSRIAHSGLAVGAAFQAKEGRLLFCALEDGLVIWDLEASREVKRWPLHRNPESICAAADGKRVAISFSSPAEVKLIDLETGRELASWNSQVGDGLMAWSADGQLLAIGSNNGQVYVWDVPRGQLASVLQGHTSRVTGCWFTNSGHLLATASWDGTTRLWDAASGEALVGAVGNPPGPFSPDDRRLPFYDSGKFGVWEVAHGRPCRTLHPGMIGNRTERNPPHPEGADLSSDGRLLAVACTYGVALYDAETGLELAHLPGACATVLFHPDGRSLITSGDSGLHRWPIRSDRQGGSEVRRIGPPQSLGAILTGSGWAAWLPGYRSLAVISDNRRVVLVDLETSRTEILPTRSAGMTTIAISPDGQWAASGGYRDGVGIQVWNLPQRKLERTLPHCDGTGSVASFVAFSADGKWLVSHSEHETAGGYYFWHVGTWERGTVIRSGGWERQPPRFSQDGRLLAMWVWPQQIRLANPATGAAIAHLSTLEPVAPTPLAFSADGTKLFARTNQGTALLWDLRALRTELAKLHLDWDVAPCPPATPSSERDNRLPLEVTVDAGDLVAREKYSLILAFCPFHAEAYYQRGLAYTRFNQHDEAFADFSRAVFVNPDHAEAHFQRGLIHSSQGRFAEALADLDRTLTVKPEHGPAKIERGFASFGLHDWANAIADFSKALEGKQDDWQLWFARGEANAMVEKWQDAASDFSRAIQLKPDCPLLLSARGLANVNLALWQNAVMDFSKVIELKAKGEELSSTRVQALIVDLASRKRLRPGKSVVLSPSYEAALQNRGLAYGKLGQWDKAVADYAKIADLKPDTPLSQNNLAWFLATCPEAKFRDPKRAVALAQKAVALAPKEGTYWNTLGTAHYRAGSSEEAVAALKKSMELRNGGDSFDWFFLAMARWRLGQKDEARKWYEQAVQWLGQNRKALARSPQWPEELRRFRDEAEQLLGITKK
jgi:serine/threonine protein kinase/WD40 repeat protein/tetratricopeptide (TPR) repeat protein